MHDMRELMETSRLLFEYESSMPVDELDESMCDGPLGIANQAIRKAIMYFTFLANEGDNIQSLTSFSQEAIAELQEFKQALRDQD